MTSPDPNQPANANPSGPTGAAAGPTDVRRGTEMLGPGASGKHTPWLLQYADFDYGAFLRRRNVRRIVAVLIAFAGLMFCFWLGNIFIPLAVALLIAYVLNPVVVWLECHGKSRVRAVSMVFLVFFSLATAGLGLLVPLAIQNIGEFVELLNNPERIDEPLRNLAAEWNAIAPTPSWEVDETQISVKTILENSFGHRPDAAADPKAVAEASASALGVAKEVFGTLLWFGLFLTLVPLYTFYFMLGLDRLWLGVKSYMPGTQRERWLRILNEIHVMVSAFFRGRLIVCMIVSILTVALFLVMGVPYGVFLGLLGGFGVIIPFFPLVASLIPSVLIMLAAGKFTGAEIGITAGLFLLIQGIEQFFLTPKILGKAVELHPVTLLVGVFVMASLFGVFGALLAVPLTAIAKILGREFILPYFQQLANERPPEPRSGDTSAVPSVPDPGKGV